MNVLMVLYGDFCTNTARPLVLYAQELQRLGHTCAVAVPSNLVSVFEQHPCPPFRPVLYKDVLNRPDLVFPDGRSADVVHAWTPREVVRRFVMSYMQKWPTPLVMYLEDNESWISCHSLGVEPEALAQLTELKVAEALPEVLSHPYLYYSFIGLADAVAVIQDKLKTEAPPWVYCETLFPGVDLDLFCPREADPLLREKYGVKADEKIIVYSGGMNGITRSNIKTLCVAIGLLNERGYRCKLLRSGPFELDFLEDLPSEAASAITDLGVLPRQDLPELLALADVFVQPGKRDLFEDLRLPGKLPELLAMGRPVIMPDVNIAYLLKDGENVLLLQSGSAEEIAEKCIYLFNNIEQAERIGRAGRMFAEVHFNVVFQTRLLEQIYTKARSRFNSDIAAKVWAAEGTHMSLRLANKLRILADEGGLDDAATISELLSERARYIEQMQLRVKGLEKTIADCEEAIATRNALIEERDKVVTMLDASIAERDASIAECDASIAKRDASIAERDASIAERDASIAIFQQQIVELGGQLGALENVRNELLRSTSWRVTKPLRILKTLLKVIRLLPSAVRLAGGYRQLVKRIFAVLSDEGVVGLKRRLINVAFPSTVSTSHAGHLPITDRTYGDWIKSYDTLTDLTRVTLLKRSEMFGNKPLISVVMPVYNGNPQWLIQAIDSVRAQLYDNWELCIVDDASTDACIRPILDKYARIDTRINIVFRSHNGHICAASNDALALASGEWVALMDHDDILAEHALFWVVEAINRVPDAQLIYSDEDKLDTEGMRCDPYFKPDWNLYLFRSHNLISHLGVYRKALVEKLGGFRKGLEGAQDYDLALRYTELLAENQIVHIPRVLYHWRIHDESTAQQGGNKPYALIAGEKAINEHLLRSGVTGHAEILSFGMYRVHYAIPSQEPLVSLIIPTRNGCEMVRQCIESVLAKTTYTNYEILLVDNGSDDPVSLAYFERLKSNPITTVIRDDRPFNYSALNNAAVKQAKGELICLLNNDIEVISPEWLSEMVSLALQPGVGAVGARLWYPSDTIQHAGVILGMGGVAGHSHKDMVKGRYGYFARCSLVQGLSAVTAACLVVRKELYGSVGGLDEVNLTVAFNDVDFCIRLLKAGYRNVWTPYADLYHHESVSRGQEDTPEKILRFGKEVLYMETNWGDLLANDSAYNPNLTLERGDFSLAWPPRLDPI